MADVMDCVRCYLCDHEFVEGEEPWLMFEQRLREDGRIECSLADLLGSILEQNLQEAIAHSTLLCDSCNADVLEYESLEKRFSQLRERILTSYRENATIQNLHALVRGATVEPNDSVAVSTHDINKFLADESNDMMDSKEFNQLTDIDLVEEVPDDEAEECNNNVNELALPQEAHDTDPNDFTQHLDSTMMSDNLDFAAFNEHVAQNSLPTGVLNLSDSLVNLDVNDKLPLENQDVILFDANHDQFQPSNLIAKQKNENSNFKSYNSTEDEELNFIISTDIFTSNGNCEDSQQSQTSDSRITDSNELSNIDALISSANVPKPVCKKEGNFFICLLCKISSENYDRLTLIKHFQSFHNIKFYMCEQCHQGYERRQDLKKHTEIAHIIQCECCDQTFNNTRLYRVHKRTDHNNAKPYECPVCQKMYASKTILEEHMNTHTGVRPFKCPECSKDFASKCTLQTHLKTHKDRPRPYQCDQCDKRFLNQQNLSQHKKLHASVKAFQCDVCNKAFVTQHSLQVHKIVHSGQRPFICRICGKSFARRPEIKDHERIHTGERPFKCEYCPMAFAQRTNLATHTKSTHLNEKLHKCDICLRSFKRKRLLDYHIKAVHTGERPHKCNVCGAGFVYPEHYKKHMLIHSGTKPYACEVCGKQFNSRDNRNAHRFVHSEKKPYECMECGAGFMRKPLLLTHMKQTKHINDTIIINQPQFTHYKPQENDINSVTVMCNDYNNIEECEIIVDNDLQPQDVCEESLEKIIFQAEDLLAENVQVSSITDKTIENEDHNMNTIDVGDHLIKTDLDDVKYIQFEDLDRDGNQTLTWVNLGGDVKV